MTSPTASTAGSESEQPTTTVRSMTHRLMAQHGLTTIFGNPGSNELPFLQDLPDDVNYVLGLHEGVVVGMADGYSQALGRPVLVNLHAGSGTGNAMGALSNAVYSQTPLVVTAGQQVRSTIGLESFLSNVDATQLTRPLTKWSSEPTCAADVPRAFNEAVLESVTGTKGPVYLSVPYDDWDQPSASNDRFLLDRSLTEARSLPAPVVEQLVRRLDEAPRVALILGSAVDTVGASEDARILAERLNADVWIAPSPYRLPFPNRHGQFTGVLPAAVADICSALEDYDLALVLGAPVFRYHQHVPGDYLPPNVELIQITEETGAATRAPFGEAVVADVAEATAALARSVAARTNDRIDAWRDPEPAPEVTDGVFHPEKVFEVLRETAPQDVTYVVESTSTNDSFWKQMDLRLPSSYFWPASGGLGFGMPASVGVQMALPDRQVLAVIGDGSANYGITALWSAAQYGVPVVFVILKNGTYGALRWFADVLGVPDAPGLDVPEIDFTALAKGYGVAGSTVSNEEELASVLTEAMAGDRPYLIEVETSLTAPQ
ncbi:benzoylformate decarboxylase [Citricoccus sp. GCM10030269]